ncbi:hypothetical protein DAPPUDRAFT_99611 [Daphnia pulex]|uniref:Uncharacterized protein n=1 Tax=Daphnia pulex TaxID=6669 RepID=E9G7E7_DAPPU|nr:hypothetical protein DAPPUDRAFT_99611 [Daphnia pulex]|eukprot:EFX84661.1 hypothetical protein DAPPUDRAFT_99611 [Daphnia pulex]
MTRQRQSLLQQLMVMVVVTAQVTLMLMLTTSVFPCDTAAAAAAAGPPWSSLATGPSDHAGLYCDFEDQQCRWQWSRFVRRSAAEINATIYSAPDPAMISGPLDDADGRPTGNWRWWPSILNRPSRGNKWRLTA